MTHHHTISLPLASFHHSPLFLQSLLSQMHHFILTTLIQPHYSSEGRQNPIGYHLSECIHVEFSNESGTHGNQRFQQNDYQKENFSFSLTEFHRSTHALMHFQMGYYARKVWERYNGRKLREVVGHVVASGAIPGDAGDSVLRMTLWTEDDDDLTPVVSQPNMFGHEGGAHMRTSAVFGDAVSSVTGRQQHQYATTSSSTMPHPVQASMDSSHPSRKRKRDTNVDDLTSTMQSLMTPFVKRRKRAKSADAVDMHSTNSSLCNNSNTPMMGGTPPGCSFPFPRNTSLTLPPNHMRTDKDAMMEEASPYIPHHQIDTNARRTSASTLPMQNNPLLFTPDGFTIHRPSSPPLSAPAGSSATLPAPKTPTRRRLPSSMRRQRAYSPPPMNEKYAKVLKIDNLTSTTREEDVRRALAKYGSWNILWIKVVQRDQSVKQRAFVLFEHAFEALEAKNIINFRILVDSMVSATIATQADFFWLQKIMGEQNPIHNSIFVNSAEDQQFGRAFSSYRRLFEAAQHSTEDENMGDSDEEDSFKSVRQSLFQQQQREKEQQGSESMME